MRAIFPILIIIKILDRSLIVPYLSTHTDLTFYSLQNKEQSTMILLIFALCLLHQSLGSSLNVREELPSLEPDQLDGMFLSLLVYVYEML